MFFTWLDGESKWIIVDALKRNLNIELTLKWKMEFPWINKIIPCRWNWKTTFNRFRKSLESFETLSVSFYWVSRLHSFRTAPNHHVTVRQTKCKSRLTNPETKQALHEHSLSGMRLAHYIRAWTNRGVNLINWETDSSYTRQAAA